MQGNAILASSPSPSAAKRLDKTTRPSRRTAWYVVLNALFAATTMVGAIFSGSKNSASVTYLIALFLLCSTPLLLVDRPNGRYAIALVFMPIYFIMFGLSDFMALLPGSVPGMFESRDMFSVNLTELAVLIGAVVFLAGYAMVATLFRAKGERILSREWKLSTIAIVGMVAWFLGMVGDWLWQFVYSDYLVKFQITIASGAMLTIFRMLHPVGILLLVYSYVVSRSKMLGILVIAMVTVEFAFGFVADSKELAIRGLILLIMTKFLVEGRIPKKWVIVSGIAIVLTFSVFLAYRHEVLHTRAQTRSTAMENIAANLDRTLRSGLLKEGRIVGSVHEFAGRMNLKPVVHMVIERTGKTVAYQDGYTIGLLFYAFVPRFIALDKPDSSVGRLFNKDFKVSESAATNISSSQLGELYWNFGWSGVIGGMFMIGGVMGIVSSLCSLAKVITITRVLVIVTTIYFLCFRFEGGIAIQYTLWIRSIAIILLLHWLFADRRRRSGVSAHAELQIR